MQKFISQLNNYVPYNEQEQIDKQFIIDFIASNNDVLTRNNTVGHLTASSWIVNKNHTKVLLVYHKIYNSWSWTGGHCDGDNNTLNVAVREAKEETGLQTVTPVSNDIYSVEVLVVNGHEKHGKYVNSHLHLNVTYLLQADENEPLCVKEDENTGVKWFALKDALDASTEPWFVKRIYSKLNDKLTEYNK